MAQSHWLKAINRTLVHCNLCTTGETQNPTELGKPGVGKGIEERKAGRRAAKVTSAALSVAQCAGRDAIG